MDKCRVNTSANGSMILNARNHRRSYKTIKHDFMKLRARIIDHLEI